MILCGLVLLVSGSVLVHATHNPALDTAWEDWKSTHQKGYFGLGEEAIRRTIWEKNMQLIEAHNQEYELGIHTYELGMNHLGDMTTEEVVEKMMGFRPDVHAGINNTFVPDSQPVPSCIDYRKKGYVTSVKNQHGKCVYKTVMKAATLTDFVILPHGNEDILRAAVAQVGPIAVGVDASQPTFHFYKRGTYIDYYCNPDKLTHAVLVVGYTSNTWVVKNSWGKNWGDDGYIHIKKSKNVCGIANMASFPVG